MAVEAAGSVASTLPIPTNRFRPGDLMRRLLAVLMAFALVGCGVDDGAPVRPAAAPAYNDVDLMFLQMGLAQIAQGEPVAALVERRAGNPDISAIATELRGQWKTESGTMQRWLQGWRQPDTPDPDAGAHADHGGLHDLPPTTVAELNALKGAEFDNAAVSILLGHLHNCVETSRMESAGGGYPPARSLADGMTRDRQGQVQRLLGLAG
jgi:uncharacterized protein (DUF305 family)